MSVFLFAKKSPTAMMLIAVLSTLVLGIAIYFAIHFIQRCRQLREEHA